MTSRRWGVAACLAAAICVAVVPRARAAQWLEARIDDFTLVTDANEAYARRTLRDFAVFKQALGVLAPLTRSVPRIPTQMYALDAGNWRSFKPGPQVAGFFSPRAHANYIVFDRTPTGLSSREVVYHEYMHYVLYNGSDVPLPPWWAEGVAEVFSSISEHDGKIDFGMTPRARKEEFAWSDLMPTSALLSFERDSPEYRQHRLPPMFYPQSWLTAHYFLVGRPERGRQAQRYLRELEAGTPVPDAVQAAFGISLDGLDEEIRAYRREGKIRGFRLTLSAPLPDAKAVVIRPLPESVALARLALAGLALGDDVEEASKRAQRALQLDPALPLAAAALADVRFHQDRDVEALELSRKAATADPEAVVAAGRVQWQVVDRALRPKQARPTGKETVEALIDAAVSLDEGRREPTAGEIATLQAAREQLLPLAGHPELGLEATLVIVDIDELLRDRKQEAQLAVIQQAVTRYPTHPDLAMAEARVCEELGRTTAALASASRAARYARSPALRHWIENWIAELEAAAGASR
ncbi:MAG: hypothetical protein AB7P31_10780 [Steroidobacteraceae bacterium]